MKKLVHMWTLFGIVALILLLAIGSAAAAEVEPEIEPEREGEVEPEAVYLIRPSRRRR